MGTAASIDAKCMGQTIDPTVIHKHETSFSRAPKSVKSSDFDPLIHEMRFDKIWSEHPGLAEPNEEDLGKELREIAREETMKICPEISQNKFGALVWDAIRKANPEKIHFYEYLASYPSCDTLQDRSRFMMKLLSMSIGQNCEADGIRPNQETILTLLDLSKILHQFDLSDNVWAKKEFDRAKYLTLGAALLSRTKQGNFFRDESIDLDLDLIMYRKFKHEPFEDVLDRLSQFEIDVDVFSRMVISILRTEKKQEVMEGGWDINDGGNALSKQPELRLPQPRQ